jgi:phage major head subunit gpT-like protein
MTIVNSDFLAGLMTNYRAIFKQALDEAFAEKPIYQEIATKFNSNTSEESYGWMGANPTMSEWTDKRQLKDLKAFSYTLTNKHYEGTIAVNRDTYEDDKYGMIAPRIQGLARRAVRHMNQAVIDQLEAGQTLLAYDGGAFFKTNRTIGSSGTIDNLKTGAYSGSSAEILTALDLAYQTMASYKDDKGVPMGLVPDAIVCSPKMFIPIRTALLPAVAGTSLPEAGIFQDARIFATPHVDGDADDFYVLCTKQVEVKPLIFQMRKEVEFVSMDKPDDSNVFMQNEFYYGVDDRFATGYGDPRTAIKIIDQ